MTPGDDYIALPVLLARGAFAGRSAGARERAGRRWAGRLSGAVRARVDGRWQVSPAARLPGGLTVAAFLTCGAKPDTLAGFRVPPGALVRWSEADRQRFLDSHQLVKWWGELRVAYPRMDGDAVVALLKSRHGEWAESRGLSCDAGAIRRYRRRLDPCSPAFDGNIDNRGRKPASDAAREQRCSPEGWELFRGIYLHANQHSLAAAWRFTRGEARRKGWAWPSLSSIRQRVKSEIPRPVAVLCRKGARRFEADCLPKLNRDYEQIPAGACWSLDGRTCDFMARVSAARGGWRRVRPVLAGVLDARSRMIVGWSLGTVEHGDLVVESIKMAVAKYGAPEEITDDNGQAYKRVAGSSRLVDSLHERVGSIFSQLGVKVHTAIPYHAWVKQIESIWNGVKNGFDRWFPSFWGGRPDERPQHADRDTRERIDQLPTLDEVRAAFGKFLEGYHATPQGGSGAFGLTPNLIMDQYRGTIRRVDPKILDLICCRMVGPVKVGRNGVRHQGIRYGAFDSRVWALQGRDVWLRIEPDRADRVTICDEKGVPLCRARHDRLTGCDQESIRAAMRKRARMRRIAKEAGAAGRFLIGDTVDQVMTIKREHAKAEEAELRKSLPAPVPPASITIVRPNLHAAAVELDRFADPAPAAADEKIITLADLDDFLSGESAERGDMAAEFDVDFWDKLDVETAAG